MMSTMTPALDCWFLTGSTAVGKTAVGVALALRTRAEIVSMDSMALYRGMDIGTAKPTAEERRAVPHHLVDVLEPHEDFSLAGYLQAAHAAIDEIRARGRDVLLVGGTPLYLKGLLRGIFAGPAADWALRRRLQQEAGQHGPEWLHGRLAQVDPDAARRLHPNDERRLLRALEVFEKTGRPISELQRQFDVGRPAQQCRVFVLERPKEEISRRIDERVEAMFAAGLVEEVRRLAEGKRGQAPFAGTALRVLRTKGACPLFPDLSRTASQAVGYAEVLDHLAGRYALPETVERVKLHTRQLAKRQRTWFRSLSECRFVPISGTVDPQAVAEQIAQVKSEAQAR
jgi:tRNA dimethylallyltransferase